MDPGEALPTPSSAGIGGYLEKWPTTNVWLLHAAFALGSGLCFVLFKFVAQRLRTESA